MVRSFHAMRPHRTVNALFLPRTRPPGISKWCWSLRRHLHKTVIIINKYSNEVFFRVRKSVLSRWRERKRESEIHTYIVDVFEPGGWCFEISWIGQSIRSNRTEIGQREMIIVHLQDVSSDPNLNINRLFYVVSARTWLLNFSYIPRQLWNGNRKFNSLLNDAYFIWCHFHAPKFRFDIKRSLLWHCTGRNKYFLLLTWKFHQK